MRIFGEILRKKREMDAETVNIKQKTQISPKF